MKLYNYLYILFLLIIPCLISCEQKTEYERLVQRELSKDIRHDSLFLGYYFGMDREEFFDYSWQLNQKNVIKGVSQIEYLLQDLPSEAIMIFYPDFYEGRIYRMPVEINYTAWAPWNRELYSDSLIVELVDLYEDIYGPGFIHTTHPEEGKESWIKIDGNRRISIYRKDDMTTRVVFLDLSVNRDN